MLVKERQWSKDYSRSLVLTEIQTPSEPLTYANHTSQYLEYIWRAQIENHRPDAAAVNTVCILYSIEHAGKQVACSDRSYLKWAGQMEIPKDNAS